MSTVGSRAVDGPEDGVAGLEAIMRQGGEGLRELMVRTELHLDRVTSEAGTIEVPVEVSDEMMPGVVCLPHGWGHDKQGTRLSVARDHPGVNNNLLAPPEFVDVISGNAAVNGIPVEVCPA